MAVDALARALAAGKVPVSAYEMAVKAGYTGTEEQFAEDMGNSGTNATNAADSAAAAAASATTAANAAGNLAPAYSASATYAVGDHVLYDGGYYVCNTAITTAEAWTAAHWTAAKVGPEITDLKTQLDDVESAMTPVYEQKTVGTTTRGYWSYSEGGVSQAVDADSGSYYRRPAIEIPEHTKIRVENSRYYNSSTSRPIIIVDALYNILAAYMNDGTLGNTDYEFVSPENAKYLLMTQYQSSSKPRVYVFDEFEDVASKSYVDNKIARVDGEIDDLKKQSDYHEPYTYSWFDGGITGSGGNNNYTNRIRTSYTKIVGDNIAVEIPEGYKAFIYLYSEASSDAGLGYGTFNGTVTDFATVSGECKPSRDYPGANYFRVCVGYRNNEDISAAAGSDIKISTGFDRFEDIEHNMASVQKATKDVIINASVSMFNKMGFCGASWESGYVYYNGTNVIERDYLSWGANLARNHGNTCKIFARHSMNTRDYLTNTYCLPKLLNDDPCGLYYIGLGGNDARELGLDYLGTIEDIKADYTQNPDTFYGNYARIIEQIQAKSPECKIVCAMYYDADIHNSTRGAFYNAVKNIANHYNLPYFNWNDDEWYANTVYNGLVQEHPTASLLSGIAYAFDRIFSKISSADEWYNYFKYYKGEDFE